MPVLALDFAINGPYPITSVVLGLDWLALPARGSVFIWGPADTREAQPVRVWTGTDWMPPL